MVRPLTLGGLLGLTHLLGDRGNVALLSTRRHHFVEPVVDALVIERPVERFAMPTRTVALTEFDERLLRCPERVEQHSSIFR